MTKNIITNRQLSAYICKVRELSSHTSGTDPKIIDAVYATLILCFNNCDEQPDESRRLYYTKHCHIPESDNNKQAINHLLNNWTTIDKINVEYWLRSAEVLIGDNRTPLQYPIIQQIITNLNNIVLPDQVDINEIVELFGNLKPTKAPRKRTYLEKLFN